MSKKPKCNICEMIKYQNFAVRETKYRYQVERYLKLSQRARNRIVKDWDKIGFCTVGHRDMALDIYKKHKALVIVLRNHSETQRKLIMRNLQQAAFNYAETVIINGVNSIESKIAARELERMKNTLAVQKRKREPMSI